MKYFVKTDKISHNMLLYSNITFPWRKNMGETRKVNFSFFVLDNFYYFIFRIMVNTYLQIIFILTLQIIDPYLLIWNCQIKFQSTQNLASTFLYACLFRRVLQLSKLHMERKITWQFTSACHVSFLSFKMFDLLCVLTSFFLNMYFILCIYTYVQYLQTID